MEATLSVSHNSEHIQIILRNEYGNTLEYFKLCPKDLTSETDIYSIVKSISMVYEGDDFFRLIIALLVLISFEEETDELDGKYIIKKDSLAYSLNDIQIVSIPTRREITAANRRIELLKNPFIVRNTQKNGMEYSEQIINLRNELIQILMNTILSKTSEKTLEDKIIDLTPSMLWLTLKYYKDYLKGNDDHPSEISDLE